jgi:hypothetical protein
LGYCAFLPGARTINGDLLPERDSGEAVQREMAVGAGAVFEEVQRRLMEWSCFGLARVQDLDPIAGGMRAPGVVGTVIAFYAATGYSDAANPDKGMPASCF